MKYISIGNCSKYNIYILIAFLGEFFNNLIFGLNSSNKEKPARFFSFRPKIRDHNLLYNFIRLASILFGGVLIYFFEGTNKIKNEDETTIEEYEKMRKNFLNNKKEYMTFNLLLISILFSLYIILQDFIDLTHIQMTFWSLEILYIGIISYFIFNNKIYRHKKIAIGMSFIIALIDLIYFFFPTTKHTNLENINEITDKNIFDIAKIKYGVYSIPLLFIAGEIKHIQRDYCWIKAKYLMDIKSLSPYKIFLTIGGVGIFFVIVFLSIFTYVPCKTFNNINKIGDKYFSYNSSEPLKLYLEYCSLKDFDENTKTLYLFYDSIKIISKEYSNTDKDNMLEIFVIIPLLFLFYLISEISRLMIVRYTDPNYIIVYKIFYYFVKRIITFIINEGDEQYITYIRFIIVELEELIGIISSLIYIEVLELKFCGLDYELKKNIDRRGTDDILEGFTLDNESEDGNILLPQNDNMNNNQNINP